MVAAGEDMMRQLSALSEKELELAERHYEQELYRQEQLAFQKRMEAQQAIWAAEREAASAAAAEAAAAAAAAAAEAAAGASHHVPDVHVPDVHVPDVHIPDPHFNH